MFYIVTHESITLNNDIGSNLGYEDYFLYTCTYGHAAWNWSTYLAFKFIIGS